MSRLVIFNLKKVTANRTCGFVTRNKPFILKNENK